MKLKIKKFILNYKNKIFENFVSRQINKFNTEDFKINGYKYFKNINEIENWGSEYSLYYQNLIELSRKLQASKEQIEELSDIEYYCGYYSIRINNYLRGFSFDDSLSEDIQRIDFHLNKFILKENIIVVRRMSNKFIDKNYKTNNYFLEKGFLIL